jgi:hypothetical protein
MPRAPVRQMERSYRHHRRMPIERRRGGGSEEGRIYTKNGGGTFSIFLSAPVCWPAPTRAMGTPTSEKPRSWAGWREPLPGGTWLSVERTRPPVFGQIFAISVCFGHRSPWMKDTRPYPTSTRGVNMKYQIGPGKSVGGVYPQNR